MKISQKWKHGAVPALLIHACIGTVYCWSMLFGAVSDCIGEGAQWAFSLAIFFLGLSAAFLGGFVERDVRRASCYSALLFGAGMILSGVACALGSRVLFFISYGVIMGIGLGLGYLSPVKTLVLWFKENKGLATGLAISGFGLAKVLATPSFEYVLTHYGITALFLSHGVFYTIVMLLGSRLLKKPKGFEPKITGRFSLLSAFATMRDVFTMRGLWVYWLIFYINISAGLAIISHEKILFTHVGLGVYISLGLIMCAVFNTLGRLGVSWSSDYLKDRFTAFKIILILSAVVCAATYFWSTSTVVVAVLLANAGYGAMFSTMPSALSDRYGNDKLSEVHGVILSAWAFAGLTGNQLASFIVHHGSVLYIIPAMAVLYFVAYLISLNYSK